MYMWNSRLMMQQKEKHNQNVVPVVDNCFSAQLTTKTVKSLFPAGFTCSVSFMLKSMEKNVSELNISYQFMIS